jgi:hypothetical protein
LIWTVRENSSTWLVGFQFDWLPSGLNEQIRFIRRGESVGLEIGNIVGSHS